MQNVALYLLVFFSAALITYLNVYNSAKFHNFFFLIYGSFKLVFYCFIYGLIGITLFLFLKENVIAIDNNTRIASKYLLAIGTGISTKGISDINLFNIKQGGEITPIGLRTISRQIDAFFDKEFDSLCFERFRKFIASYRKKYEQADVQKFKLKIIEELSAHPSKERVAAFTVELNNAASAKEILDAVVRVFGKRTLNTLYAAIPSDLS